MVRSIVGMTHRGLCRSRCHPALAQQRAERVPQGVNVNRPAAFVPLRDPRKPQVPVKDSHQPGRHGEQRRIGRQRRHGQRQTRLPLWPRRIALVAFLPVSGVSGRIEPPALLWRLPAKRRPCRQAIGEDRRQGRPEAVSSILPGSFRRRRRAPDRAWSASSTTCPTVIEANSPLRSPVSTSVL